ncbi:MAG: heavy metal translocating P-type ATPase metal-binding domain-containing protein [Vicinamibacterales bacterium]
MSLVALPNERPAIAPACAHCGQAVPMSLVRAQEAEQFCCSGCRQVHTLVREWGFDQYYRLVNQQQGALEPAKVSGRSFDDFDDPLVQGTASDADEGERRRTRLYLEGVHCTACVWLVEKLPSVLGGVDAVRLNYGSAVAEITWRPAQTKLSTIGRALDRLGYTPHVHQASKMQDARRAEDRAALARLGVAAACAMNLMFMSGALYAGEYSGMASNFEGFFRWFSLAVFVPVLGFSARPFFQTAMAGLRARIIHIDLPIALGISIGALASTINVLRGQGSLWFDSLAMLTMALLGARQLQRSAQRAALERADSLRGVAFLEFARRIDGDGPDAASVEVPLSGLVPGDRVEVRSGELVPVDGVVLAGQSALDNAVITGESAPVPVAAGDVVHAGATNLGARLLVRVDAAGAGTRVGALLAVVQDALAQKPALLQKTDALARRFVTLLLVASAAMLAVSAWQGTLDTGLARVVALLVVSCPCALGLSVPLAMSMALMRAARAGIFIKNPDATDRLQHVQTVILDKTGTLTEGHATVVRWHGSDLAMDLAQALEAQSSHRVARAFQHVGVSALRLVRHVEQVVEAPGLGISGRLDEHVVRVGSRTYLDTFGVVHASGIDEAARLMLADGLSPVFIAVDGRVTGVAGIGDALRRDARTTVEQLRRRGVHVCIASGDHADVVARVGADLGLDPADVHGGLTPEAKKDFVAAIVGSGFSRTNSIGSIVMVGDGVNDAAALALADVGIAVQGGMGASIVAADIVLTREGVRPLLDVMVGSRRLRGVIRRNITFSLIYNASVSTLALAGFVSPLLAAVLMPLSSLTVVLSSSLGRTFAAPAGRPVTRSTRDPLGA